MNKKQNKIYITTPIYYINDRPHIGHAYTTIIADVLSRYYREKIGTDNVFFLTGTDEHGAKIYESANKNNLDTQDFTDMISSEFILAWKKLDISNNDFIRTTSEKHKSAVTDILLKFKNAKTPLGNDVLYESEYEGLYCVGCEKFITESELVDGCCPDHNRIPEKLSEKNWFFKLSDFIPAIIEKIKSDEIIIYPETRKNEVLGILEKQNLPDFSISRSIKSVPWGIDIPWDKNQKCYVWVDALSNYISALDYPQGENFKKFWPADIQLLGLEIIKFHAIFWPAMLMALDLPLPKKLAVHGFFTLDGKKMSKTLGNVIDPNDLVDKYGADATKYLILSQFGFGSESDINVSEFPKKYNADLVNGLGNLVNRTTKMVEDYLGGKIDIEFKESSFLDNEINEKIENLNFRDALLKIWQVIQKINVAIDINKPWELSKHAEKKDELKTELQAIVKSLYSVAISLKPFMPNKASEIIKVLTAEKIVKPEIPIFPRIN
jgi:methionyl-tRNA synthetase